MTEQNSALKYEQACNELVWSFISKYFIGEELKKEHVEWWWVGDGVGTVVAINDYFFDMPMIYKSMKLNVDSKLLFEYYDYALECYQNNKRPEYNFQNFISLKDKNYEQF
jgi:hypothetical protein